MMSGIGKLIVAEDWLVATWWYGYTEGWLCHIYELYKPGSFVLNFLWQRFTTEHFFFLQENENSLKHFTTIYSIFYFIF